MDMITGIVGGIGAAAGVQTLLVWRAMRAVSRLTSIESRVDKFGDALTLLTDTTESAFRAVATEMTRAPRATPAARTAASAARTQRIARAATRGKSVQQIAATEDVAEGEVRLRLQVAKDAPTPQAAATAGRNKPAGSRRTASKREGGRGAVRLD